MVTQEFLNKLNSSKIGKKLRLEKLEIILDEKGIEEFFENVKSSYSKDITL